MARGAPFFILFFYVGFIVCFLRHLPMNTKPMKSVIDMARVVDLPIL
jgi:hypothetical protein